MTRTRVRLNRNRSLQPQGPQVDGLGPATCATRGTVTPGHEPLVLAACYALGRGVPVLLARTRASTGRWVQPRSAGVRPAASALPCALLTRGRADEIRAATRHGARPQPHVLPGLPRASPRQRVCLGSGVRVVTSAERSPRRSPVTHLSQRRWSQEGLSRSHGCDGPRESHGVTGRTRAPVLRGSRPDRQVARRLSAWWGPVGLPCPPGPGLSSFPNRAPPLGH